MSVCVVHVCHLEARCFTPCESLSGCGAGIFSLLTLGACVSALSASVLFKCQVGCSHLGCSEGPSAGCVLFIFVNLHLSVLFQRQMFVLLSGCDVIEELIIWGGVGTTTLILRQKSQAIGLWKLWKPLTYIKPLPVM